MNGLLSCFWYAGAEERLKRRLLEERKKIEFVERVTGEKFRYG